MLLHVYVCVYEALVSRVFVGEHLQRTSVEHETIVTLRVVRYKYFISFVQVLCLETDYEPEKRSGRAIIVVSQRCLPLILRTRIP